MSRSASMTGTLRLLSTLPPTRPTTVFFSDRLLASKIGKSTQASLVTMPIGLLGFAVLSLLTLTPSRRRGTGSGAARPS